MSLFMDVHSIEGGVSAKDVAGAHKADLETQDKYQVGRRGVDRSGDSERCWAGSVGSWRPGH
jgi:hypothetical protein